MKSLGFSLQTELEMSVFGTCYTLSVDFDSSMMIPLISLVMTFVSCHTVVLAHTLISMRQKQFPFLLSICRLMNAFLRYGD